MLRLFALFSVLLVPNVAAAYEAPFGLRWGMSIDELSSVVAEIRNVGVEEEMPPGMDVYRFTRAPRTPASTDFFSAVFHDDAGLVKVLWVSASIEGDAHGTEGKEFYAQVKSIVREKYPTQEVTEIESVGFSLYDEPDEFYQCLEYDGCGHWWTVFVPKEGGSISVRLRGQRRGEGYLVLSYESPAWAEALTAAQNIGRQRDKKAF